MIVTKKLMLSKEKPLLLVIKKIVIIKECETMKMSVIYDDTNDE